MFNSWFGCWRGLCAFVAVVLLCGPPTANGEMILGSQELASLSGFVFCDINNNGVFDSVECGIGNVSILLEGLGEGGETIKLTMITKSNGAFTFNSLSPGQYALTETQPIKYVQGKPNQLKLEEAALSGLSEADEDDMVVESDHYAGIVLTTGEQATDYDFGEWGLKTRYLSKRQLIVPEPSTVSVLVVGLLALVGFRRIRR
jgi:hypothetical protein